jgi:putative transcriptional regulator
MFRLIMGYSGWDAGQLEEELENGDWMVMPSSKELIFSKTDKDKWNMAISDPDININNFSGQSGLA